MSLVTALIVEISYILAAICFIFLKKRPTSNLKGYKYHIWTSVPKVVELRQTNQLARRKKLFPETITYNLLETNSSFHVKQRTTGNFCFTQAKFSFREES